VPRLAASALLLLLLLLPAPQQQALSAGKKRRAQLVGTPRSLAAALDERLLLALSVRRPGPWRQHAALHQPRHSCGPAQEDLPSGSTPPVPLPAWPCLASLALDQLRGLGPVQLSDRQCRQLESMAVRSAGLGRALLLAGP
jgi:hypothetical protein